MRWPPHPYQLRAVRWLLRRPEAGLFLDPGLGKTAITLAAIRWLKINCPDVWMGALVITPLRAISTWEAEVAKWDQFKDFSYRIIQGTPEQREAAFTDICDIHLTNPENVAWLVDRIEKINDDLPVFTILVVDESTKFKSTRAQRWKKLRKVLDRFDRRYILSGSPASNSLLDLYAQIYIIDRGNRWGQRYDQWQRQYFYRPGFSQWVWEPQENTPKKLARYVGRLCMEARAADYLSLPAATFNTVPVVLDAKARKQYRQIERDAFLPLDDEEGVTAANAAVKLAKCQQVVSGFIHDFKYDDKGKKVSGKIHHLHTLRQEAMTDLLATLTNRQVLIAYQFKEDYRRLSDILDKEKLPWSDAVADTSVTNYIVRNWNKGKLRRILMHASASHGLNLQGSDKHPVHIVWYGLTWSLENYEQLNARVLRQGRTGKVVIHHLVAADTVDELILKRLRLKARTVKKMSKLLKMYLKKRPWLRTWASEESGDINPLPVTAEGLKRRPGGLLG